MNNGDWFNWLENLGPSSETSYWLFAVGLALVIAIFVFGAWWALFADRPRGKRRCPRCWYDMAYSPGMTCSECGFTGRSEKDFKKTRRRWGIGLLAIMGGTILGGYVIDKANQKGWPSYLPTDMLIWTLPFTDVPNGGLYRELDNRMTTDQLTDEQWIALLEKCAEGDTRARPVDDDWLAKYGEILRIWRRNLLAHDSEEFRAEAERILLSLPPRLVFSTRDVWPADVPVSLNVRAADWWPNWAQIRVAATPNLPNAATDVHVRLNNPIQRRSYSLYLPPWPKDITTSRSSWNSRGDSSAPKAPTAGRNWEAKPSPCPSMWRGRWRTS